MRLNDYTNNLKHEETKIICKTNNELIHVIEKINYKTFSRLTVRGTTRDLASQNTKNPNAIYNKRKNCKHKEKITQTSHRKDEDGVPPEL